MQRSRVFKQSSRCYGSGWPLGLSLMVVQEQFHLKIEASCSEKIPIFKAYYA